MLLSWFKHNDLSLDHLQFITAISVGLMNRNSEYTSASKQIRLLKLKPEAQRILDKQLNEKLTDRVSAYVHFLYTYPVFEKTSGNMGKTSWATLKDLVPSLSEKNLIVSISANITNTNSNYFILLYMRTQEWQSIFKRMMRSKTDDADIIAKESEAFYDFIRNRSAGSYVVSSRTPDLFLKHTFTSYFVKTTEYANILRCRSNLKEIGSEDKRSKVDFYRTEDPLDARISESIDFIKIASKIQRSSYYLFNHNKSSVAYYDIYSWYRSNLSAKKYEMYKQQLLKVFHGLRISQEMPTFNETQTVKYNKRKQLCAEYATLITNGIGLTDYYEFYMKVVACSDNCVTHYALDGSAKDGAAYYERGGFNTSTGRDQDKFRADVEGFLAMRELIEWMGSPNNTTGVTLFTLPVAIFRDRRYLKRFSSFKEYVTLYEDTSALMLEADRGNRKLDCDPDTQLVSNDALFDIIANMTATNTALGISTSLLDKIMSTSLEYGQLALSRGKMGNKNMLLQEIRKQVSMMDTLGAFMLGIDSWQQKADSIRSALVKSGRTLVNTPEVDIILVIKAYYVQLCNDEKAYSANQQTKTTDNFDKNQIIRSENSIRNSVVNIFLLLEKLAEVRDLKLCVDDKYNMQAGKQFISTLGFLTGYANKAGKYLFPDFELDALSLRNAIVVANFVVKINKELVAVYNCIESELQRYNYKTGKYCDNNLFLVYAKIASEFPWLGSSFPFKDMLTLENFIRNKDYREVDYLLGKTLRNSGKFEQVIVQPPVPMYYLEPKDLAHIYSGSISKGYQDINQKILESVNTTVNGLKGIFNYYSVNLWGEVTENLIVCGSKDSLSVDEKQALREASRTIIMQETKTSCYSVLYDIFKFEDHYAVRGTELFLYTQFAGESQTDANIFTKVFVHEYGYIVTLKYLYGELQSPDIQEINESMLHSIKLQLGLR